MWTHSPELGRNDRRAAGRGLSPALIPMPYWPSSITGGLGSRFPRTPFNGLGQRRATPQDAPIEKRQSEETLALRFQTWRSRVPA